MGLSGQMHDGVWLKFLQQGLNSRSILNIVLSELIPRLVLNGCQGLQIACVRQLVDIKDVVLCGLDQVTDQC